MYLLLYEIKKKTIYNCLMKILISLKFQGSFFFVCAMFYFLPALFYFKNVIYISTLQGGNNW